MSTTRMETCATHGLRYDANQHDSCVLCRRLIEQPEPEPAPAVGNKLLLGLGAGVCVLVALFLVRGGLHGGKLASDIPAAAASCVAPLVDISERCMDRCGRNGTYCRADCMADLNDRLTRCPALPNLDSSAMQILTGNGDHPEWSLVHYKLQPALQALSECDDNRGTFTARVAVRPDKKVSEVAVGSRRRDVAECIAQKLSTFEASALPGGEYAFVMRAQPPAGKPMAPPEPGPNTPKLTPIPREEKPQETVLVSNDHGSNIEQLQSDLKLARSLCLPTPREGCSAMVSRLRFLFATLEPKARLERFTANVLGAGFDCVKIDTQSGFKHNTSVGIVRPSGMHSAQWTLVSSFALDTSPNFETLDEKRFPGMHAEFLHVNDLVARELSLCVSVPDDERSEWRLGVASYEGSSKDKKDDWHRSDVAAFGVGVGTADYSKLQTALVKRDYKETERLLKVERAPLSMVRAPVAMAVRYGWEPDQLEILFRAGARPNDIDDRQNSALHEAAMRCNDAKFPEMLKVLVRHGGNINLLADGSTPLHIVAVMMGCGRAWDVAIAAGADPNIENENGRTAEDMRCSCQ